MTMTSCPAHQYGTPAKSHFSAWSTGA